VIPTGAFIWKKKLENAQNMLKVSLIDGKVLRSLFRVSTSFSSRKIFRASFPGIFLVYSSMKNEENSEERQRKIHQISAT
jgi:hypothetical protein